jgi:hypothetical protein
MAAGAALSIATTPSSASNQRRRLKIRQRYILGLPGTRAPSRGLAFPRQTRLPPGTLLRRQSWVNHPFCRRSIAAEPEAAAIVLAQAQAMLSWRMRSNERRLTGYALTPKGVVGGYDPV